MAFIITLLWILVLLSALVVLHEFGHFLAAKLVGVHVEEFGLGYPPRVKVLFEKWKTKFSLNWIPLGGFVRLYGDDAETVEKSAENSEQKKLPPGVTRENAFYEKSIPARLTIILAGVVLNFLFGVVAFAGIYSTIGIPTPRGEIVVTDVGGGSAAAEAGFQAEDVLVAYGDSEDSLQAAAESQPFIEFIGENADEAIFLQVSRNEETVLLQATPQRVEENGQEFTRLGIGLSDSELKFYPWWQMPLRGMVVGVQDSVELGIFILQALRDMVVQSFQQGTVPQELSGPVGIVDQTYQSGMLQDGWLGRLNWMALISVNLAIMNLLPIPALDGGRAVFLLLEPILGKTRRQKWETWANSYGIMVLLGLIVLITLKDVWQIIMR